MLNRSYDIVCFKMILKFQQFDSSSSTSSTSSGNNNHGKRKSDSKVIATADKENHVSNHVMNTASGLMTSRNQGNLMVPFSRQALDNVHPMIDNNKNIQVYFSVSQPLSGSEIDDEVF